MVLLLAFNNDQIHFLGSMTLTRQSMTFPDDVMLFLPT